MKLPWRTISRLARAVNMPYQTVHGYVYGTRRPARPEVAALLAKTVGRGTKAEILAWLSRDTSVIVPMVEKWAMRQ